MLITLLLEKNALPLFFLEINLIWTVLSSLFKMIAGLNVSPERQWCWLSPCAFVIIPMSYSPCDALTDRTQRNALIL